MFAKKTDKERIESMLERAEKMRYLIEQAGNEMEGYMSSLDDEMDRFSEDCEGYDEAEEEKEKDIGKFVHVIDINKVVNELEFWTGSFNQQIRNTTQAQEGLPYTLGDYTHSLQTQKEYNGIVIGIQKTLRLLGIEVVQSDGVWVYIYEGRVFHLDGFNE